MEIIEFTNFLCVSLLQILTPVIDILLTSRKGQPHLKYLVALFFFSGCTKLFFFSPDFSIVPALFHKSGMKGKRQQAYALILLILENNNISLTTQA